MNVGVDFCTKQIKNMKCETTNIRVLLHGGKMGKTIWSIYTLSIKFPFFFSLIGFKSALVSIFPVSRLLSFGNNLKNDMSVLLPFSPLLLGLGHFVDAVVGPEWGGGRLSGITRSGSGRERRSPALRGYGARRGGAVGSPARSVVVVVQETHRTQEPSAALLENERRVSRK